MYDLSDLVPLTVQILDADGLPTTAGTVVLTVTLPDGSTATPTVVSPAVGTYATDYLPTQAGRHIARWVSTVPNSSFTDVFDVRPADPGYLISLADAKRHLKIESTSFDEELRGFIEAATRVVERHLNRAVARRSVIETHPSVEWTDVVFLYRAPVISLTSLVNATTGKTWLATDVLLDTELGKVTSLTSPFTGPLTATYTAGMSIVPSDYTLAARIIVQHLWTTQRPSMGARRAVGNVFELPVGFAIPNAAIQLLGPRPPVIV